MELLAELLTMNEDKDLEQLLEDLGNLKKLGLGRMVNAFKQSFRYYDDGRRRWNSSGMRATDVGNKINARETGIGPNSTFVDVKHPIKNWGTIKKTYRDNQESKPCAVVIYVDRKAVSLMIGNMDSLSGAKGPWGVTYDFTGFLDEDEIKPIVASLDFHDPNEKNPHHQQAKVRYGVTSDEKTNPKGSGRKMAIKMDYWDANKIEVKNYEAFGVTHKNINAFIDGLVAEFGARLTAKVILADAEIQKKAKERMLNRPIKREDIKLFKDDLAARLVKYKLNNAVTVNNIREFINKIFNEGNTKKLKFGGETYEAKPGNGRYNDSESGSIEKMMKGGSAEIRYYAAKKNKDDWYSDDRYIIVELKLVNMQLKPVSVKYREYEEVDGRVRPSVWKEESLQ